MWLRSAMIREWFEALEGRGPFGKRKLVNLFPSKMRFYTTKKLEEIALRLLKLRSRVVSLLRLVLTLLKDSMKLSSIEHSERYKSSKVSVSRPKSLSTIMLARPRRSLKLTFINASFDRTRFCCYFSSVERFFTYSKLILQK